MTSDYRPDHFCDPGAVHLPDDFLVHPRGDSPSNCLGRRKPGLERSIAFFLVELRIVEQFFVKQFLVEREQFQLQRFFRWRRHVVGRRRVGELVMAIDANTLALVEQRFLNAQERTSAPLEGVLVGASGHYEMPALLLTIAVALFVPWPLLAFTNWPSWWVYAAQLIVAALLAALSLWPRLGVYLTPAAARRANVHRAALAQFSARGLTTAPQRNGVLIYVSLVERVARIEAGPATLAAVPLTQWQRLIDEVTTGIAGGDLAAALSHAADGAAAMLAKPFPADPQAPARPRRHFHAS